MTDATPDASPALDIAQAHPTRSLDEDVLTALIRRTAEGEGFEIRALGIVLTDRDAVHRLNREFLDHDYPTDVLSFSLDEDAAADGLIDGEVYVDLDTAAERAPEFGTTFEDEARRYVVHGLLHLMGYDDATDAELVTMRTLEDRYLGADGPTGR